MAGIMYSNAELDVYTAILKERTLVSNYIPKYKFGGYKECYLIENKYD